MLTLDQVKLLENKVESLIEMVKTLCGERDALRDILQKKDKEIEELSVKVDAYETEQAKIEERVVNALNQLDVFQNSVASAKAILAQPSLTNETSQTSSDYVNSDGHPTESATASSTSNEKGFSKDSTSPSTYQDASSVTEEEAKKTESEEDTDKQMDIF